MNRKFFLTTKDTKKKRHGFEKLNKSKKAVQRTALQDVGANAACARRLTRAGASGGCRGFG